MFLIPIVIIGVGIVAGLVFFMFPDKQPPAEDVTASGEIKIEAPVVRQDDTVLHDNIAPVQTGAIRNGVYTADAEYYTPKRQKHIISVTLSLQDNVITSADVQYDGAAAKTPSHIRFDGAYEPFVLGAEVADLDLSRVGGASLTTTAFNEALKDITSDASL